MLLQLSQFFPFCFPPPSTPLSLRQSHHHCSCPLVMYMSSLATPFPILYFTSPWLFCDYLFVLFNPLTSSLIFPHPTSIWQPSKCSLYPWFWICSFCLVCSEGKEGRMRGRKISMCGCLSHIPYWGPPLKLGPNWELNWQPFGLQAGAQSTEPYQPRLLLFLK